MLGWRGLDQGHDDRYALHVANQILGGGSSSRLFQAIREDRGLAYSVYSWVSSYSDAGLLGVYAGTSPGRSAELLEALDAELATIVDDRRHRTTSSGWPSASCAGPPTSVSRTPAAAWPASGACCCPPARSRASTNSSTGSGPSRSTDVDGLLRRLLAGAPLVAAVGPVDARALAAAV